MLSKYADLILGIIVALISYNTLATYGVKKEVSDLKKINADLLKENIRLNKKNTIWRIEAPKILRIGELNADSIKDLNAQQQLLNKYLGEVLNVSNLIPNKELGIEASDIIEELRQRVRWNEEIERQQVNDTDFYKGD